MYYSQNQLIPGVERQFFDFRTLAGSGISSNREQLINDFLETDFTHVLFIDEDTAFDPEVLSILMSRSKQIVGANYMMRVKGKGLGEVELQNGLVHASDVVQKGGYSLGKDGIGRIKSDIITCLKEEVVKLKPPTPVKITKLNHHH